MLKPRILESHLRARRYIEQLDRFKRTLSNLIITNHLEFHLYRDGEFISSISIGELQNGQVISKPESYETFKALIRNACKYTGVTIRSAPKLAKMMAAKARLLAHVIEECIDTGFNNNRSIKGYHLQLPGTFSSMMFHQRILLT